MNRNPLWFLFNIYGWIILVMSVITAVLIEQTWIVLLGVIGYQLVLFVELTWGGSLRRTGRTRLAKAEQENRELQMEQTRLVGTIREQGELIARLESELEKGSKQIPPDVQPSAEGSNIPE